ncbi:MAG TPA: TonB family protein [Candidatus Sulfotelmatobacter sp.]|nr:TonB family protein [Candidatus Sulfotelmatobacter sp.]
MSEYRSGENAICREPLGETMLAETMFTGTMFADSLLQPSFDQRFRRSWTTLSSFGLQALAMGLLLLLPLVRPGGIPLLHRLATPVSLGQPAADAPPIRTHAGPSSPAQSNLLNIRLLQPTRIPTTISPITDDAPPQPFGVIGTGLPTGGVPGLPQGIGSASGETRPILSTPPPAATHPIHISHMSPGSLVYQPQPEYPQLARSARVEGTVVLAALISKDGTIKNLHVLTGHPMLVRAAVEAVSNWRYHPYILNGEPVEVETQVTVNFFLAGH